MDKDTRNGIERATQRARKLLQEDFSSQLEGTFDVLCNGSVAAKEGAHLSARQAYQRDKIIAAIEHKRAAGMSPAEAVVDYLRDAAFTTLNRFVALKMLEARELVQECITKGEQSAGYREFCGMAPGVALLPDAAGYRLYIESLFDELSTEIKVLFDRRDPASVLWPKRATFEALLDVLNATDLANVWGEDETIGWVYQFFNSDDERRAMRKASQAPQNSRELAVRNQFFTPRYVVQFLTDNTLGRIWYEMRGGKTSLVDRCEYMVRRPDESYASREKKDPRDLRVLDPACGSGHFLLYAFDVLIAIYAEAHADPSAPKSEVTGNTLVADYPSIDDLRRKLPALIFAHNLYGVDIDPRCAQIAPLALWMRAQRAFRGFGIVRAERPMIRRSNIVVAEPLVTDDRMLPEFLAKLGDANLGRVFMDLVETLKLAGDLGLLLRVEELIVRLPKPGKMGELFAPPEARIRAAIADFVATSGTLSTTKGRLFADDAAQGVGLLETAGKKFDVVLMNPPFGDPTARSRRYIESRYPRSKCDLLAMFVERGVSLCQPRGRVGAITSRTALFLESFSAWRKAITEEDASPDILADLGYGVLDAMVEVAMYTLEVGRPPASLIAFRGTRYEEKESDLHRDIKQLGAATGSAAIVADVCALASLPNGALAYWVPPSIVRLFQQHKSFGQELGFACKGISTADNFRFLRLTWEVDPLRIAHSREDTLQAKNWVFLPKGGEYSPFYDDVHLVMEWARDGYALRNFTTSDGAPLAYPRNVHVYFRRGLTYPYRTTSGFNLRVLPAGCGLSDGGQGVFLHEAVDNDELALCVLGYFYTRVARASLEISLGEGDAVAAGSAARNYVTGAIEAVPSFKLDENTRRIIADLVRECVALQKRSFAAEETSREFVAPLERNPDGVIAAATLFKAKRFAGWVSVIQRMARIENAFNDAFSLDAEALAFLDDEFGAPVWNYSQEPTEGEVLSLLNLDTEDLIDRARAVIGPRRYVVKKAYLADRHLELVCHVLRAGPQRIAEIAVQRLEPNEMVDSARCVTSWAVGVAFGRWDVEAPGCVRDISPADAFAPIPAEASGELSAEFRCEILVDDEGHAEDFVPPTQRAIEQNWGQGGLAEVEEQLRAGSSLRNWLRSSFFEYHCTAYSKSRRNAPLYWQLATPTSSYSVWLYLHAFTKDTLYKVQNEYVGPKLTHEEQRLESLRREFGENPNAAERKALAAQGTFVDELRALLQEVKRVAPLWRPYIDDGVIINFAPLWRLVPHHKPWQKELKNTWDSLCAGDYDWAHLAMHLWPERVVAKCAIDRSLAIAHDLENAFWLEGADGKWQARTTPLRPIEELVDERTSSAVKAALKNLLEAPTESGNGRARGGRRAASAATTVGGNR